MKGKILEAYNETKAYYCLDCGKCTSNCPVARYQAGFSPRMIVKNASVGFDDDIINDPNIWDCLTCDTCTDRCRSGVDFAKFVRVLRSEAIKIDNLGICSHGGMLQGLMRFMTMDGTELKPKRLDWLMDDLKVSKDQTGDVLLFTGCMPIFPSIFDHFGVDSRDILRASIKLLNHAGIVPVVTENERCCGHDMIWTGEVDTFNRLAKLNAETFKKLNVKTIVVPCPEGYYTLKEDYPTVFNSNDDIDISWDFEVLHISEYLAKLVDDGVLTFPEDNPYNDLRITYHDSCRLGRFMGVFEAPRVLLNAVPGVTLNEMEHNKDRSLCCGVSNWTNCTNTSKSIRAERLMEAKDTGAEKLLTSCPKCEIHFKCYTSNEFVQPQIKIDIEDIVVFLAKAAKLM